jgi:hypothetical protein
MTATVLCTSCDYVLVRVLQRLFVNLLYHVGVLCWVLFPRETLSIQKAPRVEIDLGKIVWI